MKIIRYWYWILVIGWMVLIFYLSHQPAQASNSLSGGVMDIFVSIVPESMQPQIDLLHTVIRKTAHFSAYFMLAVLTCLALHSTKNWKSYSIPSVEMRSVWRWFTPYPYTYIALLICFLYAVSDEIHQTFIPGRSGEVRDVIIDTLGAFVGIVIYGIISRLLTVLKSKR